MRDACISVLALSFVLLSWMMTRSIIMAQLVDIDGSLVTLGTLEKVGSLVTDGTVVIVGWVTKPGTQLTLHYWHTLRWGWLTR
jgi:hypothetical protein